MDKPRMTMHLRDGRLRYAVALRGDGRVRFNLTEPAFWNQNVIQVATEETLQELYLIYALIYDCCRVTDPAKAAGLMKEAEEESMRCTRTFMNHTFAASEVNMLRGYTQGWSCN